MVADDSLRIVPVTRRDVVPDGFQNLDYGHEPERSAVTSRLIHGYPVAIAPFGVSVIVFPGLINKNILKYS